MVSKITKPKIVWLKEALLQWEEDFIAELFPPEKFDLVIIPCYQNPNIPPSKELKGKTFVVLFSIQNQCSFLEDYVTKLNPQILIHLGDEYYTDKENIQKTYPKVPPIFRQYGDGIYRNKILKIGIHFNRKLEVLPKNFCLSAIKYFFNIGMECFYASSYLFPKNKKFAGISKPMDIYTFPLAYIINMLNRKKSLDETKKNSQILSKDRKYNWSFVGNFARKSRKNMVEEFQKWDNYFIQNNLTPNEMYQIYKNSLFVPVGRGNLNIHCFRMYEAIISGAIPVVVAHNWEIKVTIDYKITPPIIFAKSWRKAREICQKMSNDEIDKKRIECAHWWCDLIKFLNNKIETAQKDWLARYLD